MEIYVLRVLTTKPELRSCRDPGRWSHVTAPTGTVSSGVTVWCNRHTGVYITQVKVDPKVWYRKSKHSVNAYMQGYRNVKTLIHDTLDRIPLYLQRLMGWRVLPVSYIPIKEQDVALW